MILIRQQFYERIEVRVILVERNESQLKLFTTIRFCIDSKAVVRIGSNGFMQDRINSSGIHDSAIIRALLHFSLFLL